MKNKMRLNEIPVRFDQEAHTYTNIETGETYKGITGTLIHHLFPDKYAAIPKDILAKAAERGSLVHEEIELVETLGVKPSSVEGKNYLRLKELHGLKFLESEYTVSDLKDFATNVDALYEGEGENVVDMTDYKTTSKFDKESVSWQLSICAYFFELNNPHLKVGKLFGTWLRGDIGQIIPVERHSVSEVKALIQAYLDGVPYDYSPEFPDYITENEDLLYTLGHKIKDLQEEYDRIKGEVLVKMIENGDKTFDTGKILVTVTAPSIRKSFDSKAFKEDYPEQYSRYIKETKTSESLKLTLR